MRDFILKMLVSGVLAAVPFAFQVYVSPIWPWIVGVGALGAMAGYAFGLPAVLGGICGAAAGLWFLTRSGLIGNGGDGDTFYLVGGYGAAAFVLCAVMAGMLRGGTERPKGDPSNDPGH